LFANDVVSFGTRKFRLEDRDGLEREQWRAIWEKTSGFHFDLNALEVFGAGAIWVAAVSWSSRGRDTSGADVERRGRATLVLAREGAAGDSSSALVCVHSHFSLAPS
jgi:ketosteroid isomerase-like protein